MSVLLQELLVAALVIAAAFYAAWRLMSVRQRLRTLAVLAGLPLLARSRALTRLRERTLAQQLNACGGCAAAPTPDAPAPSRTPGAPRR